MSNTRRKKAKRQGQKAADRLPSCHLTSGEGAKPYDGETLALLHGLVPGVEIVHPLGIEDETDKDRLSRARGMAGHHRRAFGAVVRVDILTTKYFQDLALGSAAEIHIMRSKVKHVDADQPCPFGTMVVVFNPRKPITVQNGQAPIYWERA